MGKFNLSNAETQIMEIIWNAQKEITFSELLQLLKDATGKDIQRQTLRTQIVRLIDKGVLKSNRDSKHILYSAAVTKEHYTKEYTSELLAELFDGSVRNFILALSGGEKLDEKTISELREFLEE